MVGAAKYFDPQYLKKSSKTVDYISAPVDLVGRILQINEERKMSFRELSTLFLDKSVFFVSGLVDMGGQTHVKAFCLNTPSLYDDAEGQTRQLTVQAYLEHNNHPDRDALESLPPLPVRLGGLCGGLEDENDILAPLTVFLIDSDGKEFESSRCNVAKIAQLHREYDKRAVFILGHSVFPAEQMMTDIALGSVSLCSKDLSLGEIIASPVQNIATLAHHHAPEFKGERDMPGLYRH